MPVNMSNLNIKNFSYFAFNCKEPLSKRHKEVITAIHVLLGVLFPGLGHGIMGIVYVVKWKDFKWGLVQISNDQIRNQTLKLKAYQQLQVMSVDNANSPPIYRCISKTHGSTIFLSEEELKKLIQEKSTFIEDLSHLLDDDHLNINFTSRVFREPIPEIDGLDFTKIDYLSVTGWTDSIPRTYGIKVFYKNGKEEKTSLFEPDFKKIKENNLANIENPGRFFNVSRGNALQEEVYKIKELTGLDLALVDKISVYLTQECIPPKHCSKIYFSNGKVGKWELDDEGMKKIEEFGRVPVEWYKESLEELL